MFKKYELIGGAISILCMATALYLIQTKSNMALNTVEPATEVAAVASSDTVVVPDGGDEKVATEAALRKSIDNKGNLKNMVVDDVKVGDGR